MIIIMAVLTFNLILENHSKELKIVNVSEARRYVQCSFSSRFPRDVTDSALMNSSNSMEPSWNEGDIWLLSLVEYCSADIKLTRNQRIIKRYCILAKDFSHFNLILIIREIINQFSFPI